MIAGPVRLAVFIDDPGPAAPEPAAPWQKAFHPRARASILSLSLMRGSRIGNPMTIFRLLLALPFIILAAHAHAATLRLPETGYSATRIVQASGMAFSGKVHAQNGKERWETVNQGVRSVSILLPEEGRFLLYMPDMNMAMEMNAESAAQQYGFEPLRDEVEAVEEGSDMIEGENTTRYRVTVPDGDVSEMRVWLTADGIPLKMTGSSPEGDFTMLLKDLKRGDQDAALFRLPAGVTPMKMPMGMPGMPGIPPH
jgi:hypothetical protein